jgi:hypothetical protein
MKRNKLAIIHFQALELYPPVMNCIRFFGKELQDTDITVYTTKCTMGLPAFATAGRVKIRRLVPPQQAATGPGKAIGYLYFYFTILLSMIRNRPGKVLYFETLSSVPALVYKLFFSRRSELFIHYHEYASAEEAAQEMKLNKLLYEWEKKNYRYAQWISQTNDLRMERFLSDIKTIDRTTAHVLPNFPPASWHRDDQPTAVDPLRIVYVGSLGMDSMYVREFADWVIWQKGRVIWDIYTNNISGEAASFLKSANPGLIRMKGPCEYYRLPEVLANYDVGVVLYKGIIPNHVLAVSNKLFEYLTCGLDVWYPPEMTGTTPYKTEGTFPKVLAVDFSDLSAWSVEKAIDRTGLSFKPQKFSCEEALWPLLQEIKMNHSNKP